MGPPRHRRPRLQLRRTLRRGRQGTVRGGRANPAHPDGGARTAVVGSFRQGTPCPFPLCDTTDDAELRHVKRKGVSPVSEQTFDLVVLGAGSGGYAAALRYSQFGKSVALIEKDKVGGTCLHVGCIPTKALLHSAEVADVARDAAKYGVAAQFGGIDVAAVTAYREGIVAGKWKGLQGLLKSRGITTIEGEGRLTSPN